MIKKVFVETENYPLSQRNGHGMSLQFFAGFWTAAGLQNFISLHIWQNDIPVYVGKWILWDGNF